MMMRPNKTGVGIFLAILLAWTVAFQADAKGYSSGGHSYSSHSSSGHSFSSGSHSFSSGSHSSSGSSSSHSSGSRSSSHSWTGSTGSGSSHTSTFNAGNGHSYTSGSSSSSSSGSSDRHSYTSGKSYSSGAGHIYGSGSSYDNSLTTTKSQRQSGGSSLTYDSAAAHARQEDSSRANFNEYKRSQTPPVIANNSSGTYQGKPPPVISNTRTYSHSTYYIPDSVTISTRPVRIYNYYNPYYSRPWVTYHDPYNSFFWWWLLDRSLDDRAYWAYNHYNDMDPARYQALMATDAQLQARVSQLEAQQLPRDPNYVPPGIDQDLMYSDQYVTHNYQNRPTHFGVVAFWALAVPCAVCVAAFFIWLIWFKRWQPAT